MPAAMKSPFFATPRNRVHQVRLCFPHELLFSFLRVSGSFVRSFSKAKAGLKAKSCMTYDSCSSLPASQSASTMRNITLFSFLLSLQRQKQAAEAMQSKGAKHEEEKLDEEEM